MIKQLTQSQFIKRYSKETYEKVCKAVFKALKDSGKTKAPHCHGFMALTLEDPKDGSPVYLFVEASAIRKEGELSFGIVKMQVSDEKMPDEMLDRYSEIRDAGLVEPKLEYGGYYWVRFNPAFHGAWVIATYVGGDVGDDHDWRIGDWKYTKENLVEVDGRKIVRDNV